MLAHDNEAMQKSLDQYRQKQTEAARQTKLPPLA